MLLGLLGFFFQYKLVDCDQYENVPNFNETHLSEQLHQSLIQVNAFLKDIERNIHSERSALRTVDYEAITTKDQDFFDYSLTDIWWNGSQATGANTPQINFLPTHEDHGTNVIFSATPIPEESTAPSRFFYPTDGISDYVPKFTYDTPISLPVHPGFKTVGFNHSYISRPTFPFSIPTEITQTQSWDEKFTSGPYPPGHPLYRLLSPAPGPWTPDRDFIITRPTKKGTDGEGDNAHVWPSLKTPSAAQDTKSSGYPWPSLTPPILTSSDPKRTLAERINPEYHTYVDFKTATTSPISDIITTLHPNISRYVQEWLKQITTSKTALTMESPNESTRKIPETQFDNSLPTKGLLDQNASKYLAPSIHREGPPSTTLDPDFATASEDPWMPTATAKQEPFFIERPNGLLYLGTTPAYDENTRTTVLDAGIAYIPKELQIQNLTTIAGDVLYGEFKRSTPQDTYRENLIGEMEREKRGYMLTYLVKLTELVATKNPEHVSQVVRHTQKILVDLFNTGRLAWFGEPLIQVTMNLGIFLSETEMDVVRSYASMMHQMLKIRKESLAVDVNSIIDYAELLYEDDEGLLLFDIIKEFDEYPNINKTSYELADDLIEYFLMPYRRLSKSERRQTLLDSVNYALAVRFPNIHRRFYDGGVVSSGNKKTPSTKERLRNIRTRPQPKNIRGKQQGRRDIKKMRRPIPTPVHSEFNYENILRRKYDLGVDIFPQLRRTKPITNIQKRFSVITSAQHERFRGIMTRSYMNPNSLNVNLGAIRRTTDYKSVTSNFFLQPDILDRAAPRGYQRQAPSYHRLDKLRHSTVKSAQNKVTSFLNEMKKRFMISQAKKKTERLKLKAKLIKRIAEGSSYSDEEASLKMNLIDALLNRHNKTKKGDKKKIPTAEPESDSQRLYRTEASKTGKDEENTSEEDTQNGI